MRVPASALLLLLAPACGASNAAVTQCHGDRTPLDGVCVTQQVADYVACVRAQGAKLGDEQSRKLSAEAGFAGARAGGASEVSAKLERQYSASDANTLEIIRQCGQLRSPADDVCGAAGTTLVSCGFQNDPAWIRQCQASPTYQTCLKGAGSDCNALSACGFAENARQMCGGAAVVTGAASCPETGACTSQCSNGDAACFCKCFAALRESSALAFGLIAQCNTKSCFGTCGANGAQTCGACFQTHCGALFDQACKGH